MPASRKRIGFLPSAEVQKIISEICTRNNLSQSKVTGILVEEALEARNLYKFSNQNKLQRKNLKNDFSKYEISNKDSINKSENYEEDNEYKLIKEYVNYKNFKKILSLVQSDS